MTEGSTTLPITREFVAKEIVVRRRNIQEESCEKLLSTLKKDFTRAIVTEALIASEGERCVVEIGFAFSHLASDEDVSLWWRKCRD
jgi:hypothetical protein